MLKAEILPVNLGENVCMPCHGPAKAQIVLVEWTRPDLESPEYVFFFRDERSYTSYQHWSFVGRVELKDKEMKNGDVSLILSSVRISDVGVYECRISQGKTRSKRANIKMEPIQVISLKVEEEGAKTNVWHIGAAASLILSAVVVILVAVIFKKRNREQK
ncbi:coxsackievirus and adenovirus receptor homolog isoform X2 [Betta splendens]|uniref:Coxsackievirus and adenovirus receptor homolog isoform X2 n=1 Tax=Betta splendens TaxID=158456 RepID=A0A9W2XMK5_BETSP|nr:coxsackievirus and adenovirus receptor homolog isoform X2 [Betta splendens]